MLNEINFRFIPTLTEMAVAPKISLPNDIDLNALKVALKVNEIEFHTLPIGKTNIVSRNGVTYGIRAMNALIREVRLRKPEGRWGHFDESSAPVVRWVNARMQRDNGIVYGLGFSLNEAASVYLRSAAALKAPAGTSIFGYDATFDESEDTPEVIDFRLIAIDLLNAHGLAGVDAAEAIPVLHRESIEVQMPPENNNTPSNDTSNRNLQLENLDQLLTERNRLQTRVNTLERQLTEVSIAASDFAAIAELFNTDQPVLTQVQHLIQERNTLRKENSTLLNTAIEAAVNDAIAIESARPLILMYVKERQPATAQEITETLHTLLENADVKKYLENALIAETGGVIQAPKQDTQQSNNRFFTNLSDLLEQ